MINSQKITQATSAAFVRDRKALIDMLNESGAKIKPNATKGKVLDVLQSFITSNRKFADKFTKFLFRKGYLHKNDVEIDPSNLSSSKTSNGFLNADGEGEPSAATAGAAAAGAYTGIWGSVVDTVSGVFKRPEADTATINGILALEQAKLQQSKDTGKYLIAGVAIFGVMAIGAVLIYKMKK